MKIDNATILITVPIAAFGAEEVLAGERARQIKQGLTAEPAVYLRDPSAAAPVSSATAR